MKIGETIKVRGLTQKGKNRIRENGDSWIIEDSKIGKDLSFAEDNEIWLLIKSVNNKSVMRWMKLTRDKDFRFVFEVKKDKHFAFIS